VIEALTFTKHGRKRIFQLKESKDKAHTTQRMQRDHNNNKMERLNGEIRDREKTMRGLNAVNTSILTGYQIYHNYF
jgi:hypothetical protein